MKKKQVKYSDVLIEAKTHLQTSRLEKKKPAYLCYAIFRAAWVLEDHKKGRVLQLKIMTAIRGGTVSMWLSRQGIPWSKLKDSAVQEYRHRWLDHLIKQFKEAGK